MIVINFDVEYDLCQVGGGSMTSSQERELAQEAVQALDQASMYAEKSNWSDWKKCVKTAQEKLIDLRSLPDSPETGDAQLAEQIFSAADKYCQCSAGASHCALERHLIDRAISILKCGDEKNLTRVAEMLARKGHCSKDLRAAIESTEQAIALGSEIKHKSVYSWECRLSRLQTDLKKVVEESQSITPELLRNTPDNRLLEVLFQHLEAKRSQSTIDESLIETRLNDGWRMVDALFWLEGDVGNGGFVQYFDNTEGIQTQQAIKGYDLIGASEHAEAVGKAVAIFDYAKASNEPLDSRALESLEELFSRSKFQKKLDASRAKYIRKNPELFTDLNLD